MNHSRHSGSRGNVTRNFPSITSFFSTRSPSVFRHAQFIAEKNRRCPFPVWQRNRTGSTNSLLLRHLGECVYDNFSRCGIPHIRKDIPHNSLLRTSTCYKAYIKLTLSSNINTNHTTGTCKSMLCCWRQIIIS